MKIFSVVFLTFPLLCLTHPVENQDTSSAIVVEDSDHAESESSQISKRSGGGSFDIVNHLKTGILSGVSRASASLASGSSGGSGFKSIDSHNSVDFDPWTLKKSVLNTLFQAVKAITGGVTAIKGQLIKGSGYALSASGKLVAASGDKVTDVGKAIVHSAQLIPASPGVHPIAKFGSLSSLSSGASKGSIPLSSSGSGPAVHSETITTYEIPSGHGSYGPPSKAPSYSSTQHQYLPPPGAYSGGAPFTGAVAFEHSPSLSYLPTKYGIPLEGPTGPSHYGISPRDAKSAAKALKEIIHLLPTTETKTQTEQIFEQYPIPNDPIPDFKLPPFGPIESISHTETITTAFGSPSKNSKLSSSPSSSPLLPTPSNIPEKITLDNHGHPTPMYNPHAYDVFHSLTFKKINSLTDQDISSSINSNFNNKPVKSNIKHTNIDFDPTPQLPPHNKPFTSFNLNANKQISSAKQNYLNYLNSFPTSKPLVSTFNPQPFQIPLSSQIQSINNNRRRRRTTKRHSTSKSKSKVHSRHTFSSLNKIQKSLGIQARNSMNFNKLLLY